MPRLLCIFALIASIPANAVSFASTSSDPADRAKELSAKRCATTFKRMQNFVRYWSPRGDLFTNYIMYNPKKVGFVGYDLLGDLYFFGCDAANLSPDKSAAFTWYQNAAIAHVPESQWKVGRMLYEGDGVTVDQEAGLKWLTSAAIEGSAEAGDYLKRLGEEVPRPMVPNTFTLATQAAKQQLDAARAAQWRAVFQDLGELVVSGAVIAASVAAGAAVSSQSHSSSYAPTPTKISRYRPVYCQYQGTVNSYYPNSVSIRISQMCQ